MDWPAVIAELQQLGMKQPQIAAACGCRQSTVSELARGATKDPRHSTGEALRKLLDTKRGEAAEKAEPPATPPDGADGERRDAARGNDFPDLDRRTAVGG